MIPIFGNIMPTNLLKKSCKRYAVCLVFKLIVSELHQNCTTL